jgi:hypothetical protein
VVCSGILFMKKVHLIKDRLLDVQCMANKSYISNSMIREKMYSHMSTPYYFLFLLEKPIEVIQ